MCETKEVKTGSSRLTQTLARSILTVGLVSCHLVSVSCRVSCRSHKLTLVTLVTSDEHFTWLTLGSRRSVVVLCPGSKDICMMSEVEATDWPLHRLVWTDNHIGLDQVVRQGEHDLEAKDPRGRSPLMLAVTLCHVSSVRVLLSHKACVSVVNCEGWSVVQEAVASGNPELLQLVLQHRDWQRHTSRSTGIPILLEKLKNAPDFYVEMKWQFTSWLPFVSHMCPSDTYKVYKQGSEVRVDTTLLGFHDNAWIRGNRSYVFRGDEEGAEIFEIDHDAKIVHCDRIRLQSNKDCSEQFKQSDEHIEARMSTPICLTFVDTDKINFDRSKKGVAANLWGLFTANNEGASGRVEDVNGYQCKVFSANNVDVVTRTRTEHMTERDKRNNMGGSNNTYVSSSLHPLQSILGMAESCEVRHATNTSTSSIGGSKDGPRSRYNPHGITIDEYLKGSKKDVDVGCEQELTTKIQSFSAQLWLCEDYPLSLQEQVVPIVDLMAISNAHFQKLRDFITCSMPSGFPVKIEIPLFHVLNARITFGNIFGLEESVRGVSVIEEKACAVVEDMSLQPHNRASCVLDENVVFSIPEDYSRVGAHSMDELRRQYEDDDDERLLRYALRQSVRNNSNEGGESERECIDIWEALQSRPPNSFSSRRQSEPPVDYDVQRAIQLSLAESRREDNDSNDDNTTSSPTRVVHWRASMDSSSSDELAEALRVSKQEEEERRRRVEEDEETLQRILKLSLTEK